MLVHSSCSIVKKHLPYLSNRTLVGWKRAIETKKKGLFLCMYLLVKLKGRYRLRRVQAGEGLLAHYPLLLETEIKNYLITSTTSKLSKSKKHSSDVFYGLCILGLTA